MDDEDEAPTVPDVTGWITTVLDLAGTVLVTVALALGLWPVIGAFALAAAGGFVWAFSAFVMWRATSPADRPSTKRARAIAAWVRARRAARQRKTVTATAVVPIVGS